MQNSKPACRQAWFKIFILILAVMLSSAVYAGTSCKAKTADIAICPVTKTKIDKNKAYAKTVYKEKTYYFCCAGCPEQFKKNPKKFVK